MDWPTHLTNKYIIDCYMTIYFIASYTCGRMILPNTNLVNWAGNSYAAQLFLYLYLFFQSFFTDPFLVAFFFPFLQLDYLAFIFCTYLLAVPIYLKLVSAIFYQFFIFLLNDSLFKNWKKNFFHLKSSFCSRDIQFFVVFTFSFHFFQIQKDRWKWNN